MLKGIPSIINADLLWVLRSMGHGDQLIIADSNFPAQSVANKTSSGKLIQLNGVNDSEAIEAILTLFPLDTFVDEQVQHMQVVNEPNTQLEVHKEVADICRQAHGESFRMGSIERFEFYKAAGHAYAVVQTNEARPYGCFILTKGVIF